MRILIVGWFSFESAHATAGDLLACEVLRQWVEEAGCAYDVAMAPPFSGGVNLRTIDPAQYSHLIFVCGPFQQRSLEARLLNRFSHCRLIGLNVSMGIPPTKWNPFDFLVERDSVEKVHPDISFLSKRALVPVIGICLLEEHEGQMTEVANQAIRSLVSSRECASVAIDTRLDVNSTGLRTPAEVESLLARMDVVLTTRLHGTALSLKNGVPVIAIDPQPGGGKVSRQAQVLGWPCLFRADALDPLALRGALDFCLSDEARSLAKQCADRACSSLQEVGARVIEVLQEPGRLDARYLNRISSPATQAWMAPLLPSPPRRDMVSRLRRWVRRILTARPA